MPWDLAGDLEGQSLNPCTFGNLWPRVATKNYSHQGFKASVTIDFAKRSKEKITDCNIYDNKILWCRDLTLLIREPMTRPRFQRVRHDLRILRDSIFSQIDNMLWTTFLRRRPRSSKQENDKITDCWKGLQWHIAMGSGSESEGPGFKPWQLQATFDCGLQKNSSQMCLSWKKFATQCPAILACG